MIFAGKRPDNLGVNNGQLASCPKSPNCVSSQTQPADTVHFIEPLTYTSTQSQALANLKTVIESLPRTTIITEIDNYLYAEFKSALMGYVDDVEFYIDSDTQKIHVRSASRLGQSDLGVNRKRVEEIREKLNQMK